MKNKIPKMYSEIAAVVTATVMIVISILFSKTFSVRLMASTILCAIAFIYVGFSLKGNPFGTIVMEVLFALAFYFLALIGYVRKVALLGYGIIAHGIWDILHHESWLIDTDIPSYWPLYCSIVDFIYGMYILFILRKSTNLA